MTLRIIWFFILIDVFIDAQPQTNCPEKDLNFEKVIGLRPSSGSHPAVLYKGEKNEPGVTSKCLGACHSNAECISFVIFYNESACYWFKYAIQGVQELENELDTNAAWFIKTCYKDLQCKKAWIFERVPGATLVGNNTKVLPNVYTRTECQLNCLNERQFKCRSVKFKIKDSDYGPTDIVQGICILSDADRHLYPSAFRAAAFDDEYFENQCSDRDYQADGEFCSYEEYDNVTMTHIDIAYQNQSKDACLDLCEQEEEFNCRGYSLISNETHLDCYLHSEDSKLQGPKVLREHTSGKYWEKTPCLNISITCSEASMTVEYHPRIKFLGRMYMEGYSEQQECFVRGGGTNAVLLKLSLLMDKCGIIKAIAPDSRSLIGGTMILQYNPLVQTQGDRIIRVGCVFGNDSKVLAGTGITITNAPNHASPLLNTTGFGPSPSVVMRVIDLYTQQEVTTTQIGQELQLVVEYKNDDGSLDLWAAHLVAMTEDSSESILLLDDNGCPTNLNIFPPLTKIITNHTKLLIANFQAFKFSSSAIVRFSVIVQFCPKACTPIDCGNEEQKRIKRELEKQTRSLETVDGTKIITVNRSEFDKDKIVKMPLECIMIVNPSAGTPERLVLSDGKILVAGYDYLHHEVCLDYSLFVGLIVTWILIQLIFLVCCIVLVRRYKKHYEAESTTQSLEHLNKNFGIGFSNLDRRVHFAENRGEHVEYT